ncbi:MAG: hypothetical protein HKL98_01345 [Burkholderiales bacterium]|nr:hypothetical protein [Burkholderiales bacterium]
MAETANASAIMANMANLFPAHPQPCVLHDFDIFISSPNEISLPFPAQPFVGERYGFLTPFDLNFTMGHIVASHPDEEI